jgi:predicted nucleotidyltransferase
MIDKIYAKRDEIYAVARALMAEKLWVSGSCARKEESPESDIDFRVKFGERVSLLSHVHMINSLSAFFGRKVDVVSDGGLSPYIGKYIGTEAVEI